MKIRIDSITADRGMDIDETIPVDALNARMNEAVDNDITFLRDPHVRLHISKRVQGADISGHVHCSYKQPCSRCAETIEIPINVPLNLILKHADQQPRHESEDIGLLLYEGEHVDLEEIIQEHLILKLSPYLLPECNSAGDCCMCERNFLNKAKKESSDTVKLGDLLGAAGVAKK